MEISIPKKREYIVTILVVFVFSLLFSWIFLYLYLYGDDSKSGQGNIFVLLLSLFFFFLSMALPVSVYYNLRYKLLDKATYDLPEIKPLFERMKKDLTIIYILAVTGGALIPKGLMTKFDFILMFFVSVPIFFYYMPRVLKAWTEVVRKKKEIDEHNANKVKYGL